MSRPPRTLFCFGLGYTGRRLASALQRDGWQVRGTVRGALPAGTGLRSLRWVAGDPLPAAALQGVSHILSTVPPTGAGDPALAALARHPEAAPDLVWVGYLSTPAIYGDRNGAWVDEDTEPAPQSPRGQRRLAAERAWVDRFDGHRAAAHIFRLAGIYGPGRSAIDQVRAGTARRLDKPGQIFNRIFVDDIVRTLKASMAAPRHGRIYLLADDHPCESREVVEHAAHLLGVAPPPLIPFEAAALSPMARSFYAECKRLRNDRIKSELGIRLTCPTYREGLATILAASP